MSDTAERPQRISVARALGWWLQGAWFWKTAPLRILFWSLLPLAFEALLQALPVVGIVASKLIVPLVSGLSLLAFDRIVRRQPVDVSELLSDLRRLGPTGLAGLVIAGFAVYLVQVVTGYVAYGPAAIDLLLWGDAAAHPDLLADRQIFLLTLVLVALAVGMLLLFFAPLVVLQRLHPVAAFSQSAGAMLAAPAALIVTYAISAMLFSAALTWGYGLGLLLLVPLLSAVYFMAYRDVFVAPAAARTTAA